MDSRLCILLVTSTYLFGLARTQDIVNANSAVQCNVNGVPSIITVILNQQSSLITDDTHFAIYALGPTTTGASCNNVIKLKNKSRPPGVPTSVTYNLNDCDVTPMKVYGTSGEPMAYVYTAAMMLAAWNFTQDPSVLSDIPSGIQKYYFSATCILGGQGSAGTGTGHISPGQGDPHNPQKVITPTDAVEVLFQYQSKSQSCVPIGNDTISLGTPLIATAQFSAANRNYQSLKVDRCYFAPSEPNDIMAYSSYALDVFDDGCPTGLFQAMGGMPKTFTDARRGGSVGNWSQFEVFFNAFAFKANQGDGSNSPNQAFLGYYCYLILCPGGVTDVCDKVSPSTCWNTFTNTTQCVLPKPFLDKNMIDDVEYLQSGAVRVLKRMDRHIRVDQTPDTPNSRSNKDKNTLLAGKYAVASIQTENTTDVINNTSYVWIIAGVVAALLLLLLLACLVCCCVCGCSFMGIGLRQRKLVDEAPRRTIIHHHQRPMPT